MHEYLQALKEIKEKMLKELVSYKEANQIQPVVAAEIKTLASGVEKLCHVIEEMEGVESSRRSMASGHGWYEGSYDGGSYRGDGGSYRGGSYDGGSYEGGSYEGGSYEGGSYDGSSGRRGRNAMGRFTSRDSGGFYDKLENLMMEAPSEHEREMLRDYMQRARK